MHVSTRGHNAALGRDGLSAPPEVGELQQELSKALAAKDKEAEIDCLLRIGDTALDGSPQLALFHYRLAEKVILRSGNLEHLHEAVGGQGRAFRREKRIDEAIEKYKGAEQAADKSKDQVAQVQWMLRRASAHRTRNELGDAVAIVARANALLRPRPSTDESSIFQVLGPINFADMRAVATLAELEGQTGLNLQRQGDEQGAEDHYRSARYFAVSAQDLRAVNIWATNVGNACSRAGRYDEGIECYEQAIAAAHKSGDSDDLGNAALQLSICMASSYRHEEGADRLRALAEEQNVERLALTLLDRALELYDQGMCAQKAIDTAKSIEARLAGKEGVRPDYLERVESTRTKYQSFLAQGPTPADGPPVLDIWLPHLMSRAEQKGDPELALESARLVCDVRLAAALRGEKHWKRLVNGDLLNAAGLDHRVVFDALRMLLEAERVDDAIELLQRLKAPSYCVPELVRQQSNAAASPEVAAYARAARELEGALDGMASPAPRDVARPVNELRRASERLRQAGEALREIDPLLLARLGGSMRRRELIDALPYEGGIGIVDFVIGATGTVGVVLSRGADGVEGMPLIGASFTAAHAKKLFDVYRKANVPQRLGGAQTEALLTIGKLLHDRMFCGMAQVLSKRGITQLILIPDILTRNLPLHLSLACGKEFNIPGIDTKEAGFLCEVMPVEYAPCLQAVAASQLFLRPREIRRVTAFADPQGDLPGMRESMEQFGAKAADPSVFRLVSGAAATKEAVNAALPQDDVVLFGTHGKFNPGALDQTGLLLNGDPWTAADMMKMPDLKKRALLVLVACEAGAVAATPDDRNAWGIPGALLSAGSSAVLANLWPVETLTATYLLERFLAHLGHRGFRPAAALFRAVRDLRRLGRNDALDYCRRALERYKRTQAPASVLVGTRSILQWVEDTDVEHPFAHPFFWGATTVFGSGWHLPAGASVSDPLRLIENVTQLDNADGLLREWKAHEALEIARGVAARTDGALRGHAYTTIAWASLQSADLGNRQRAQREARRLVNAAERIAAGEEDEMLMKRVSWLRERMEKDYVVENDD